MVILKVIQGLQLLIHSKLSKDRSIKVIQKFGHTAGIQCACNSLFAICWSVIKRVTVCTTSDLDYILENGDSMYKSLNTDNILNVDDLPHNISVEGYMLTVSTNNQFDLLEGSYKENNTGNGLIFFISGYTFPLIWSKSAFFLCDSHSRDEKGYITSNGTSVLLKFKSLHDVQNYITEVYLVQQNTQSTFCQIQYVHVETQSDISLILNSFNKNKEKQRKRKCHADTLGSDKHEKLKAQMRERRENLFETDEHEKVKAKMRERLANF